MSSSWRRITAQVLWLSYAGLYFVALMGMPFFGSAIPLVMAVPLLAAAILFASIYWLQRPGLVAGTLLVTTLDLVVAMLLVGGPGTVWTLAGRQWINPPGLPGAVAIAAFVLGLSIPLVVTACALRAVKRDRTAVTVPSAG